MPQQSAKSAKVWLGLRVVVLFATLVPNEDKERIKTYEGWMHEEVAGDEHRHRNQGAEGTRKFGEVHDRSYFKMSASETAASVTTVNTTNSEKMRKWWRQCTARANSATVA